MTDYVNICIYEEKDIDEEEEENEKTEQDNEEDVD